MGYCRICFVWFLKRELLSVPFTAERWIIFLEITVCVLQNKIKSYTLHLACNEGE